LVANAAPQPPQNFALCELNFPQSAQGTGNAAPHSTQKSFPAGTSAWQFKHFMLETPAR
jgi:hypothetical protein